MTLRYTSLGSCSTYGNAYLVLSEHSRLLIDCGISCRRLEASLQSLGIPPNSLDAIFVTHEHGDHTRALALKNPFSNRNDLPVYGPSAFWDLWCERGWSCHRAHTIQPGQTVQVGDVRVSCFAKPHDTVEPVGYLIESRQQRLAALTDLGEVPPELTPLLRGCEHLIIESNHDVDLQYASRRSRHLIQRVVGKWGHLSNQQAAQALSALVTPETRTILLAHLSLDCNTPALAWQESHHALQNCPFRGTLTVAPPYHWAGWLA